MTGLDRVWRFAWMSVTVVTLAGCGEYRPAPSPAQLLANARDAHGVFEPRVIHASGTLDKHAEGQGLTPWDPSPGPYRETLAVDTGGVIARAYHERRYDGTTEEFTEIYPTTHNRTYVVAGPRLVVPAHAAPDGTGFAEERAAIARRLPATLLIESSEETARPVNGASTDGLWWIETELAETTARIGFQPESGLIGEIRHSVDIPGRGTTEVRWWFDDYRDTAAGLVPHRYGSHVGDRAYVDMTVDSVTTDVASFAAAPDDYRVLADREVGRGPDEPSELTAVEVAPDVFQIPDVRSGFAPLVVRIPEGLVVVDAPASFPLLGTIPAGETDPGPPLQVSRRFVEWLARRFPDSPLHAVIITHAHEDHAAGLVAFVERGVTVVAHRDLRETLEDVARAHADRASEDGADEGSPLDFIAVDSTVTLGSGASRIEAVSIPDNPHARGMLLVHHPASSTMFVSDLVTPTPLDRYPDPSHSTLDRFFAEWIAESGREPDAILGMHGDGVITAEHLERLRRTAARSSTPAGS